MTTLHKAAEQTRGILKWVSIGIAILIAISLFIKLWNVIKARSTPPPPPTVSFGKLPSLVFPQNIIDASSFTYFLNTLSGTLPGFPDRTTVYALVQAQPDLLALSNVKILVQKTAEFLPNPTPLSDILYQWKGNSPPWKIVTFNILTYDFDLTSSYLTDPTVLKTANLGDENQAVSQAKQYLNLLSSYPGDIDENKTTSSFFAITNGTLIPATSLSTAQIIRIDFFQNDVDKIPVYYPKWPQSIMNVLIGSGDNLPQIVEAHYVHRTLTGNSGTYPIKTAKEAFQELQNGNAYIASYKGSGKNIGIRDISLGYYISDTTNQYLQPIIVFQGDDGFFAFVNAIPDIWTHK